MNTLYSQGHLAYLRQIRPELEGLMGRLVGLLETLCPRSRGPVLPTFSAEYDFTLAQEEGTCNVVNGSFAHDPGQTPINGA